MKKFTIGLSLAALAAAGTAYAAQPEGRQGADADSNGVVTRAEAEAQAVRMFTRMDANSDGRIDDADRQARREARRTKMFDALDANSDGQISRDEYMNYERPARDGERAGKHRMGKRGHYRGGRMMMGTADANKDGAISQAEFTAAALKRFDAMDANSDGQVTKEERKAARDAMRAQWREKVRDRAAD